MTYRHRRQFVKYTAASSAAPAGAIPSGKASAPPASKAAAMAAELNSQSVGPSLGIAAAHMLDPAVVENCRKLDNYSRTFQSHIMGAYAKDDSGDEDPQSIHRQIYEEDQAYVETFK